MKLFTLNHKEATVTFFLDELPTHPVGDNFVTRLRQIVDDEIRRRTFHPGERVKSVHGLGYVVENSFDQSEAQGCRIPIHYDEGSTAKLDVIWETPNYVHHVREEITVVIID